VAAGRAIDLMIQINLLNFYYRNNEAEIRYP